MPLIKAYAKVNLALDVLYRRDDGYHELCSLMHSIDLCDDVVISEDEDISFESNIPLPRDACFHDRSRRSVLPFRRRGSCRRHRRKTVSNTAFKPSAFDCKTKGRHQYGKAVFKPETSVRPPRCKRGGPCLSFQRPGGTGEENGQLS